MRVFGVLLLLALSFAEAAWAAPAGVPHLADIGAKPEEIARVVGNRQFAILQHARPFEANGETYQARFAMGLAVVNAPAAHVRATVLDFAAYSEFVPQAEKVRVLKASKRELDVEYNLSIDLPIRNLRSRYVLRYRAEDDGSLVWHLVRGDMDANSGRWEFFPLQDGRTLLVYTQWSDMDSLGFTMRMMFRAQPDLRLAFPVATTTLVVEAIRRRAEGLPVTEPAPVTAPVSQPEIPLLSDPQSPVPLDALRFLSRSGTVIVIHPRQWIQTRAGPLDLVFVSSTAHVKT